MTRREREGYLWIILASVGFSTMPTMVKLLYLHSDFAPMDLAIWRYIFAVPLIGALVALKRRTAKNAFQSDVPRRAMLLIGVLLSGAVLTTFFGLERMPASIYVVLFYSYPAMVTLLSLLLGEAIGARVWLALALALLGVVLTVPDLSAAGSGDLIGVALALVNAAIVAVYYVIAKRALSGVADVSGASAWMMVGTLLVLLLLIPLRGLAAPPNLLTVLLLLGVASVGTALPIFAINNAIQRIGAAQASLVSTVEPPLSIIVAMLVLGEVIVGLQWLGAALILGSVIFLQLRPRAKLDLSIAHEAS